VTEFDKGMTELNKATKEFFHEVSKELRIDDLAYWLSSKLQDAMIYYWNYKLKQ